MVKIVSGVLILRKSNSTAWSAESDNGMKSWVSQYVNWLETEDIALMEAHSAK